MIFGRKVTIRPPEADDQAYIAELNADPVVRGKVVGWDWPASLATQNKWFESHRSASTFRWMVLNAPGERLGLTGLWDINWHDRHAMTALKLGGRASVRGQGYGTDAIMTVMAFAFYDVGLNRLYSSILCDNAPSLAAYVRNCGWSIEGTAREHVWRHGKFVDVHHVGITKSDFDALPGAAEYISRVTRPGQ